MEFLFELLFEIVVEGSLELGSKKTVPMPLRVLAAVISLFVFFGIGGFLIYIGYRVVWVANKIAAIPVFIVGALLIYGGCVYLQKIIAKEKQ